MSVKAGRATVGVIARSLLASILPELLMPVVLTRHGARSPDRQDLRLRHLAIPRPQADARVTVTSTPCTQVLSPMSVFRLFVRKLMLAPCCSRFGQRPL